MATDVWIALALLALNTFVALALLVYSFVTIRRRPASMRMYAAFTLACPIIGPTALGLSRLMRFLLRSKKLEISNLSFSKERERSLMPPDEDTEMNYMPLQDALVGEDPHITRRLLMDLLKDREVISVSSVSRAVSSTDAETSHYAASAITDILSDYRATTQRLLLKVKQTPADAAVALDALNFLHEMLSMNVMEDIEQRSYVYTMDGVAETLFQNNKWFMTSQHYLWMTDLMLEIGDVNSARKWVERCEVCRANELDTYKCVIHLYYRTKERTRLFDTVDTMKKSNIWIDKEMLDLIRILNDSKGA